MEFRINVSYGTFPSWERQILTCAVSVEISEVLCMDLAPLTLGKGRMLKLHFTKTSLVAFMGKTEFIQVHRMTKLLEESLLMKLHCCEQNPRIS